MNKKKFPVIALVGQKNVGKSTLFNRLTCTNIASISNDHLGYTRDRQYGYLKYNQCEFVIIDTGGFDTLSNVKFQNHINHQITIAIKESNIIFFMVNGRYKESSIDYSLANYLRKLKKSIFVVVNKVDDSAVYNEKYMVYDYYMLGIKNVVAISAIHGYGIKNLLEKVVLEIPKKLLSFNIKDIDCIDNNSFNNKKNLKRSSLYGMCDPIILAIVGRPNSGKSTFINFVLKTSRVITSDTPGTTRDSIYISTIYNNQKYILIDTAGIRKRKKINDFKEQISVSKTLQAFKHANITLFMIDASEGVVDQDLSLLRLISNHSRSLVVVINKWDSSATITTRKNIIESYLYTKINFLHSLKIHFISSLYGNGIQSLFQSLLKIYNLSIQEFSSSKLTRIMNEAIVKYPPPFLFGTRISPKPKYVHIGGYNPITIIIHGKKVSQLSYEYQRYLKKYFYQSLDMDGVLIRIRFKDSYNSFNRNI